MVIIYMNINETSDNDTTCMLNKNGKTSINTSCVLMIKGIFTIQICTEIHCLGVY